MALHPRHRGDCADFFATPDQPARIELDLPVTVLSAIEHAAARTGRTWNDQFIYVMGVYLGYYRPDFDDGRNVEDWRTLLRPCRFRFSEAEEWNPFPCLWRGRDHEHEAIS